jgi:hypothetical protein
MNVILDTNAIYYLDTTNPNKDMHLTDNEFDILKANVENQKLKIYISWLSMIEISSHLKVKPSDFATIQKGVQKLFELKPLFLPDPETMFKEYILNKKTDCYHKSITDTKTAFASIKLAPDVTKLEKGFSRLEFSIEAYRVNKKYIDWVKRKVDLNFISDERAKYEQQFKNDVIDVVLELIIRKFPHYERKIRGAKRVCLTDSEKQSLFDNEYHDEMIKGFEHRGQANLSKVIEEAKITKEKFEFLDKAYQEFILSRILEFGKRSIDKNDYNDMHFNVYFHKHNDFTFITDEKKQVVFNELKNADKCKGLKELCQ